MGAVFGLIAHHVIPVSTFPHQLVQAAARLGFPVNRGTNGVLLTAAQHTGGHPRYIAAVTDTDTYSDSGQPGRLAEPRWRVVRRFLW